MLLLDINKNNWLPRGQSTNMEFFFRVRDRYVLPPQEASLKFPINWINHQIMDENIEVLPYSQAVEIHLS